MTQAIVIKRWAFNSIFSQAQERADKYGWHLCNHVAERRSWRAQYCDMVIYGTVEAETEKAYKLSLEYVNKAHKNGIGFTVWMPKKAVSYMVNEDEFMFEDCLL